MTIRLWDLTSLLRNPDTGMTTITCLKVRLLLPCGLVCLIIMAWCLPRHVTPVRWGQLFKDHGHKLVGRMGHLAAVWQIGELHDGRLMSGGC